MARILALCGGMASLESANLLTPLLCSHAETQAQHTLPLNVTPQNQCQTYSAGHCAHDAEKRSATPNVPADPNQQHPGIDQQKTTQYHERSAQIATVVDAGFQVRTNESQPVMSMPQLIIVQNTCFQATQ